MSRYPTVPILFAVVACACQAAPANDPAVVRSTLDSILAVHAQLYASKDLDALMEFYTSDAVVRAPHAAPVRGRDAIRSAIGGLLASYDISDLEYHTEELAVFGDSALQIGSYRWVLHAGGDAMPDGGETFALWIRGNDGRWRVHRDILNSTSPLPGQQGG